MAKVSESIWSKDGITIPMADVQHIEKAGEYGYHVITKHTKYNFGQDCWENPIFLGVSLGQEFKQAWCRYRMELEGNIMEPNPPPLGCSDCILDIKPGKKIKVTNDGRCYSCSYQVAEGYPVKGGGVLGEEEEGPEKKSG